MARLHDWPSALCELIRGARSRPFQWGEHDCLLFAARAVLVMTGTDPAAEVRGTYRTALGAVRRLQACGFPDLESAWDSRFPTRVAPRFISRGDIVAIPCAARRWRGLGLGIAFGPAIWAPGPDGLVSMPVALAVTAWRV